jgi:N-methylhydantoinase B
MPIEATEHTGPVIIWRKELRPDSGGAGTFRGGLGQLMEIGVTDGHAFDFSAMFDRIHHPARGRAGGADGAATTLALDDQTRMRGKGRQTIPYGRRVMLACPGGGGYGEASKRDRALVKRDLAYGYISIDTARQLYGLTDAEIQAVTAIVDAGGTI